MKCKRNKYVYYNAYIVENQLNICNNNINYYIKLFEIYVQKLKSMIQLRWKVRFQHRKGTMQAW